jgi:hypothetical protein
MASRRRLRRKSTAKPARLPHWRADGQPKARFRSQDEANRAALGYRLDHGLDLAVYPCEICGGWHVGNSPDA